MGVNRLILFQESNFTPIPAYFEHNSISTVWSELFWHLCQLLLFVGRNSLL